MYTGVTVLYLFLGEQLSDTEAVQSLIPKISYNYIQAYYTLTLTFVVCPYHDHPNGE